MRLSGKRVIRCIKKMKNGKEEFFIVVVKSEKYDQAVQEYKRQGYTVS